MKLRRRTDTRHRATRCPLSDAPARRPVRVMSLDVDPQAGRRLADLGITVGAAATVVGRSRTAVIVAVRGGRLAIGMPLADGVFVEPEPGAGG